MKHTNFPRSGFGRRFGASIYDALLAAAIYMTAGALGFVLITLVVASGIFGTTVQDAPHLINEDPIVSRIFQGWGLFWVCAFYAWFWHKGQSLGMRAWRLKVQHTNGQPLHLITAFARLFWSLLGLGNLMLFFNPQKQALQDSVTHTEVVVLSPEANNLKTWRRAKK